MTHTQYMSEVFMQPQDILARKTKNGIYQKFFN